MELVEDRLLVAAMALGLGLAVLGAGGCQGSSESLAGQPQSIVSGTPTSGSPATVYLQMGPYACTGTLITPKIVLTAAHCLEDANSVEIFFGSDPEQGGTWLDAVDWEIHPQGDIAILTLQSAGPVTPAPIFGGSMGSLESKVGGTVHIVGFGAENDNGSGGGHKREGLTKLHRLEQDIMFTGSDLSGSWTCYGDSGGPNYMDINGIEFVIGVTSFGTAACGTPEDGAVRTDTYFDWIGDYIAAHDPQDCSADGQCDSACATPDPDCDGGPDCSANGQCNAECAADVDPDCSEPVCNPDNVCNEDCAAGSDPDCEDGTDETDATDATDETDSSSDASDGDGGGSSGGCSTTGRGAGDLAWLLVLAGLALSRRRRSA